MKRRILRYLNETITSLIFLVLIGILVFIQGIQPKLSTYLFLMTISLVTLLSVILLAEWLRRPFNKTFLDEGKSYPFLRNKIITYEIYENLRICGTSCTSIFPLFDSYVKAMSEGKSLHVCILNPDSEMIINYLDDCERDKNEVVSKVRKDILDLENKIDKSIYDLIRDLVTPEDAYGKNLVISSILVWLEAHRVAKEKANRTLKDGLEIYLYDHLPTLKAWIFGENHLLIGGYGPMPGGVGINNPIHYIKGNRNRRKTIIDDCRRTINFLIQNEKTKRLNREIFLSEVNSGIKQ